VAAAAAAKTPGTVPLEGAVAMQGAGVRSSTVAQLDGQHLRRTKIVKEIQETETSYVDGLKILIKVFLAPLHEAVANRKPIISQQDIRSMFSFVEGMCRDKL
jgi:hypothetical protein